MSEIDTVEAPADELTCQWFALCDHVASGAMTHPVLGAVLICDRCRDIVNG
jgi:hypothetical protein